MSRQAVAIPLGLPLLEASCSQPGDESNSHDPPIWPCSGWGLPAITSLLMAGSSYLPISPLLRRHRSGLFLWHFPSGHPAWTLSSTLPVWSSDFPLSLNESSRAATRPTDPAHIVAGNR